MYVAFALLADAANVTADGKLNILGVFDAVRADTLPAVHPRAHLVARLKAVASDAGAHQMVVRYSGPGGVTIHEATAELTVHGFPAGATEMDIPFVLPMDLQLAQAGPHALTLVLDGAVVARLPLEVLGAAPAPPSFPLATAGSLVS